MRSSSQCWRGWLLWPATEPDAVAAGAQWLPTRGSSHCAASRLVSGAQTSQASRTGPVLLPPACTYPHGCRRHTYTTEGHHESTRNQTATNVGDRVRRRRRRDDTDRTGGGCRSTRAAAAVITPPAVTADQPTVQGCCSYIANRSSLPVAVYKHWTCDHGTTGTPPATTPTTTRTRTTVTTPWNVPWVVTTHSDRRRAVLSPSVNEWTWAGTAPSDPVRKPCVRQLRPLDPQQVHKGPRPTGLVNHLFNIYPLRTVEQLTANQVRSPLQFHPCSSQNERRRSHRLAPQRTRQCAAVDTIVCSSGSPTA